MTDEQQPDIRWAPMEPAPSNRGRIALIVGLVVAALVVVGVLLFFLLPRGEAPTPGASGSPSPSASPTASASATATPVPTTEPTTTPDPDPTVPVTEPPTAPDPSLGAFRDSVRTWLDDSLTGLDIVGETSGQESLSVLNTLQADAQRLAESAAPGSIATEWSDGVAAYQQALTDLRSSAASGTPASDVLTRARQAAEDLRTLVEL
ncbi:hypothetical protein [Microbacterium foliorum]|uniref:hypothetical protein n=1 Tax=Microbacterium foliorum TaxID=104336 RepID=UPI001D37D483|nr:hypothetical protein [Microbacterium foliorum]CAH0129910.1 hypothetical protein SRABI03_00247 [Microbacterium foliorum]CAH0168913.1 hypothetical protein SRABI44_01154 [Microbacterium foliorum]